ncbi:MAG: T9SS type A sorting domain-containing protein, partial [Bdellovibrionales bacterium]|nr:T9SS type A sorting domain-containing protein [Bdellovibrionales bacterium]
EEEAFNRIEIIDQQGKLIYDESINEQGFYYIEINLPAGMYYVKMSGDSSPSIQKILLMK